MRPNSKRIGILITDGKSQDNVIVHSQNLRDQGIELYAIGEQRSGRLIAHNSQSQVLTRIGFLVQA